jgi:hypothetical protein
MSQKFIKKFTKDKICNKFMNNTCNKLNCKFYHNINVCYDYYLNNECLNDNCEKLHYQNYSLKKNQINKNFRKTRNTIDFKPLEKETNMKLVLETSSETLTKPMTDNTVFLAPNIFKEFKKYEIYEKLLREVNNCIDKYGIDQCDLLKIWHGSEKHKIDGTHLICNDRTNWKNYCPTFNYIIERLCHYFNMDAKSTRLNIYDDNNQWKPLHHDQNYKDITRTNDITVAISFGQERDIILQNTKYNDLYLSIPSGDGHCYTFTHHINCTWKHGVDIKRNDIEKEPNSRISVIVWGTKKY